MSNPFAMRKSIVAALCLTACFGCGGAGEQGENLACSWSQDNERQDEELDARICANDEGGVRAYNFRPGTRITLDLPAGPEVLSVKGDGTARVRVDPGLGIVAVTGTASDGSKFANGLSILPAG